MVCQRDEFGTLSHQSRSPVSHVLSSNLPTVSVRVSSMQTRRVCCPVEGMHPNLSVRRQLPGPFPRVPFPSVDGSTTAVICRRYISSDLIGMLVIFVPHEWNVLLDEFSQRLSSTLPGSGLILSLPYTDPNNTILLVLVAHFFLFDNLH